MSGIPNPPAFPESTDQHGPFGGMSLRDWFAGQALANILSQHKSGVLKSADAAYDAYAFADAMLAARSKGARS